MKSVKERHNITLSPQTWKVLKGLKRVQGKSISELIEIAVWSHAKNEKYDSVYFKIMSSVSPVEDKENKELTDLLDSLTETDLEVVNRHEI